MTDKKPKHRLVLHVAVSEVWADDLEESAAHLVDDSEMTVEEARLDVVTNEWFREECGITLVTLPSDGSMNDDFTVISRDARIVGASLIPIGEPETPQ